MTAVERFHADSINITLNRIRFKVVAGIINVSMFVRRVSFSTGQCFYLPAQKYCISFCRAMSPQNIADFLKSL